MPTNVLSLARYFYQGKWWTWWSSTQEKGQFANKQEKGCFKVYSVPLPSLAALPFGHSDTCPETGNSSLLLFWLNYVIMKRKIDKKKKWKQGHSSVLHHARENNILLFRQQTLKWALWGGLLAVRGCAADGWWYLWSSWMAGNWSKRRKSASLGLIHLLWKSQVSKTAPAAGWHGTRASEKQIDMYFNCTVSIVDRTLPTSSPSARQGEHSVSSQISHVCVLCPFIYQGDKLQLTRLQILGNPQSAF